METTPIQHCWTSQQWHPGILFPVLDPNHRRRLIEILETFFADNVKAQQLLPDGTYQPVARKGKKVRAQERFYKDALKLTRASEQTTAQFRPLTRRTENRYQRSNSRCRLHRVC